MPVIQKLRKWHFLLLGGTLILVAAFLWYWDWRTLGIPSPLRAEHFITILTYALGVIVLGIFVVRLNRKQVTIMLVGLVVVNLLAALVTVWIYRTYPTFFELLRHKSIETYDPTYVADWENFFVAPALVSMHVGLLALWLESLVMFLVRKPTDNPE
jgi:predicted neutral ceramidase superfamily lipid hydrolase